MKEEDVAELLLKIAEAAHLPQYGWAVVFKPAPEEDGDSKPVAAVEVNGLRADVLLYPLFMSSDLEERIETLCHEVAHVILHDLSDAAEALTGKYAKVLTEPEERACDTIARILMDLCARIPVDFTAISG